MPYLITQVPQAAATHIRNSDNAFVRVVNLAGKTVYGNPATVETLAGLTEIPPRPAPVAPLVTAGQWIAKKMTPPGEDPGICMAALQNLELGLTQANKNAPKLSAVRAWINGIMATYAQDQSARNDWPEPPHSFEETFAEALTVLSAE